eukprot:7430167-Heterocapsa_arctica.AAC.1
MGTLCSLASRRATGGHALVRAPGAKRRDNVSAVTFHTPGICEIINSAASRRSSSIESSAAM